MTISQALDTVTLTRTFNATPHQVYLALTLQDDYPNWFANSAYGQGARVGNTFLLTWQDGNFAVATYTTLEEDTEVAFTWRTKNDSHESQVTFTLAGDDLTTLNLVHEGDWGGAEGHEEYEREWSQALDALVRYVEKGELVNIVDRVIIGIIPGPIGDTRAEALGIDANAPVLVTAIVPNSGAEKAGLQPDDVIVSIDGQDFTADLPMFAIMSDKKPGEVVKVGFYRDGELTSLDMHLMGYPVPEIPNTFAELAEQVAPQYGELMTEIRGLFADTSDVEANTRPADGEWSAMHVIAHLIISERFLQNEIGGRATKRGVRGWSGNSDLRLNAIVDTFPTVDAILNELNNKMTETLGILKHFPADSEAEGRKHIWQQTFSINGWMQHTRSHFSQINEAIAATK